MSSANSEEAGRFDFWVYSNLPHLLGYGGLAVVDQLTIKAF